MGEKLKQKILVIDDDIQLCELIKKYLELEQYEVVLAHDGEAGLKKSSGLGLCIAKQLTEMMEGSILVESELGKGTVFKITFPISKHIIS